MQVFVETIYVLISYTVKMCVYVSGFLLFSFISKTRSSWQVYVDNVIYSPTIVSMCITLEDMQIYFKLVEFTQYGTLWVVLFV